MRCPSTSNLVDAQVNTAYDKLAVISENIENLNELVDFIEDLKDWLRAHINTYLSEYESILQSTIDEIDAKVDRLSEYVTANVNDIEAIRDDIEDLQTSINTLNQQIVTINQTIEANKITVDSTVTSSSSNPVASSGIYSYVHSVVSGMSIPDITNILARLDALEARINDSDTPIWYPSDTVIGFYVLGDTDLSFTSANSLAYTAPASTPCVDSDNKLITYSGADIYSVCTPTYGLGASTTTNAFTCSSPLSSETLYYAIEPCTLQGSISNNVVTSVLATNGVFAPIVPSRAISAYPATFSFSIGAPQYSTTVVGKMYRGSELFQIARSSANAGSYGSGCTITTEVPLPVTNANNTWYLCLSEAKIGGFCSAGSPPIVGEVTIQAGSFLAIYGDFEGVINE